MFLASCTPTGEDAVLDVGAVFAVVTIILSVTVLYCVRRVRKAEQELRRLREKRNSGALHRPKGETGGDARVPPPTTWTSRNTLINASLAPLPYQESTSCHLPKVIIRAYLEARMGTHVFGVRRPANAVKMGNLSVPG